MSTSRTTRASSRIEPMPVAECRSDEALARLMQGDEDGSADSPPASASSSAAHGKRKKGLASTEPAAASASKVVRRAGSVAAELASIIPFARGIDRQQPELHLAQLPENLLVSASTYRVLTWGKDGHRKILHSYAPELCSVAASYSAEVGATARVRITAQDVATYRHEWDQLPYMVPQIAPREGHMYVAHETGEKLSLGGELYHRIFIEEGTPPKQVPIIDYEEQQVASKVAHSTSKDARKLFGETAPLGVKLLTVKADRNGDCFFDAVCKAFNTVEVEREMGMWVASRPLCSDGPDARGNGSGSGSGSGEGGVIGSGGNNTGGHGSSNGGASAIDGGGGGGGEAAEAAAATAAAAAAAAAAAGGAGSIPLPSTALTVRELRAVVAAHYDEGMWMTGQAVGGDYFAFIEDDSLERTRANIAKLAVEADDHAYWADESAIAVLQRYLHVHFLIFKPSAAPANQCACVATAELPSYPPPHGPPRFVLLRHSHRASKEQHYDGYALKTETSGGRLAVFDDAKLPAGIKRAFADTCTYAGPTWKMAAEPDGTCASAIDLS
jgi:hypothetical protein